MVPREHWNMKSKNPTTLSDSHSSRPRPPPPNAVLSVHVSRHRNLSACMLLFMISSANASRIQLKEFHSFFSRTFHCLRRTSKTMRTQKRPYTSIFFASDKFPANWATCQASRRLVLASSNSCFRFVLAASRSALYIIFATPSTSLGDDIWVATQAMRKHGARLASSRKS